MAGLVPAVAGAQTTGTSYLTMNGYLTTNQYLVSPSKTFFAIMQGDGNFCVYAGSGPSASKGGVWCSGSGGRPAGSFFAIIQGDGNFCVYPGTSPAVTHPGSIWCSFSNGGTAPYYVALLDTASVGVYNGASPTSSGGARWNSPALPSSLTVTPQPSLGDITAFYANNGPYAGVSCQAGAKTACSSTFPAGTVLTLGNWSLASGYGWQSWGGACAGQGPSCTITVIGALNVSATFWTTTVTTAAPTNGSISGAGLNCGAGATACSMNIVPGTGITLSANPSLGYVFGAWGGDCAGQGQNCSLTMSANHSATATFKSVGTFALAAANPANGTISGAGLNCGGGGTTCSSTLTDGAAISIAATPALGYLFNAWGGACAGQGAWCNLTMKSAQSVSATFKYVGTYTLAVNPAPSAGDVTAFWNGNCTGAIGTYAGVSCQAGVKPACTGTYTAGTQLSLQSFGGTFASWGGACAGQGYPCILNMNSNQTVTATVQ